MVECGIAVKTSPALSAEGGGHRLTLELELTSPSEISQSDVTTSLLGDFSPVLPLPDQRNYRERAS